MQKAGQIPTQLPARVYELAEKYQLGRCQAHYRRRFHRFLLWILPGCLILAMTILAYYGYVLFLLSSSSGDLSSLVSDSVQFWEGMIQALFFMMMMGLELLGVHPFRGFKKNLYRMDNGLLYIDGAKIAVVRWNEIAALFWWRKRSISYLCCKDDSRFGYIEEMGGAEEISAIVASEVTKRLLPEMLAQYQQMGRVSFGQTFNQLSVTKEGVVNFSKVASWEAVPMISWAAIEDVHFRKGKIGIKVNHVWKYWDNGMFAVYKIPNPTVCTALIQHILTTTNVLA